MLRKGRRWQAMLLGGVLAAAIPRIGHTAERVTAQTLKEILHEIDELKADRTQDDRKIEQLEHKVESLENQNQQLQQSDQKLKTETTQQLQTLQTQVSSATSPATFEGFFGEHQFVPAGGAAVTYLYDRHTNTNTFGVEFEPLFLYRLNDWILFEGVIDASFPSGSGASFNTPVATAQIFLNDYMELDAGIYDLPFGDFDETSSAFWINRFVTAPLPYGSEGLLPSGEVGAQLRGGLQWGALGQDVDYTAYVGNGPLFDTTLPAPVVGQTFSGINNIATNTHSKTFGGRLRVYPLPIDKDWGRLELGASTYDGKWQNSLWLNSWGVDFNYRADTFEARGEYLATHRQMPMAAAADNRQGWYVQGGYYLTKLHPAFLGRSVSDQLQKLELLVRYSGVNQRAVAADEITTEPSALGANLSPSIFAPRAREVALGLDYWLAPSISWRLEYDIELPRAGGSLVTFDPKGNPLFAPIGNTTNDRAILTEFAIGF
jgi:cell division protein FtsB